MDEMRRVLERVEEEERHRTRPLEDPSLVGEEAARRARQERSFRPLEDPYLVGEAAATQARNERLARENGDDILIRENQRWDLFLGEIYPNKWKSDPLVAYSYDPFYTPQS